MKSGVVAILLGSALATVPLSNASVAHAPAVTRVTGSDFPTVSEVAEHYPRLTDGARELFRPQQVFIRSQDCRDYTFDQHQPRRSALMVYSRRGRLSPNDPALRVFRYRTPRAALQAFRAVRRAERHCLGRHQVFDSPVTTRELGMPRIGRQRFAVRATVRAPESKGGDKDWLIQAWVRVGRDLVYVDVSKNDGPPAAWRAIGLTRTAARAVG